MLKRFALFFLLNLLITNPSFAYDLEDRPDWSVDDVQSNIKDYGWKIIGTTIASNENAPIEIITLEKKGWILKCKVRYANFSNGGHIYTDCDFP